MKIKIVKLRTDVVLPEYQTPGSAGADLRAAVSPMGEYIRPGDTKIITTGIAVELPPEWELQVRGRSGLAAKGIILANGVGTIDSDYRGEIRVILHNASNVSFKVNNGDRIAQLVLARVKVIEWLDAEALAGSVRNEGGFGSTGLS